MEIRSVRTASELAAAWAFLARVFPQLARPGFPRSLAFYQSRFPAEAGLMVVAIDGGDVLGAALGSVHGERVLLGEVAVAAGLRRRGVGSALVAKVIEGADAAGLPEILVGAADDDAARFYARNGFDASLFIDCRGGDDPVGRRDHLLANCLAGRAVLWRGGDDQSARATVACDGVDVALRDEVAQLLGSGGHVGFVMSRRGPVAVVESVQRSGRHTLRKAPQPGIRLLEKLGVEGDAHMGATVKHRSRVARDPTQPNLRQVHLIHAELHDELRAAGFHVHAGEMGENVTTRGIDLLGLPTGTRLRLGSDAVVEITGLRTPCAQLERIQEGLLSQVLVRNDQGETVRKSGVMGVVVAGGEVRPGDPIAVELPAPPHRALSPV